MLTPAAASAQAYSYPSTHQAYGSYNNGYGYAQPQGYNGYNNGYGYNRTYGYRTIRVRHHRYRGY